MSRKSCFVAFAAALVFTAANAAQAQTPTGTPVPITPGSPNPMPMPMMQPVPPVAPVQVVTPVMPPPQPGAPMMTPPAAMPVMATQPSNGMPIQPGAPSPTTPMTVTTQPLGTTTIDPNIGTAMMLLDRIQSLTGSALSETTPKMDGTVSNKKLGGAGTVTVDRSTLDEIQALVSQITVMFPPKPQP